MIIARYISKDVLEQHPISGDSPARRKLQAALDSMPSEGLRIYRPKPDLRKDRYDSKKQK